MKVLIILSICIAVWAAKMESDLSAKDVWNFLEPPLTAAELNTILATRSALIKVPYSNFQCFYTMNKKADEPPKILDDVLAVPANYAAFKRTGAVRMTAEQIAQLPKQYMSADVATMEPSVNFDARTYWPKCSIINEIRNQGDCASGWAHAAAGALSDRLCISSIKHDLNIRLSAQDLLQCCEGCVTCGSGCKGGFVEMAYDQFVKSGIVTGGEFGQTGLAGGCNPYQYDPNFKDTILANVKQEVTCAKKCALSYEKASRRSYVNDKYFGRAWYMVTDVQPNGWFDVKDTERRMQLEIMKNGSVTANIEVYDDFYNYTKGVYNHAIDHKSVTGFHSVRVLGWGMEGTVPYWLIANSWGTTWGENGFGKIVRGASITGIEARVSAATPLRCQPNVVAARDKSSQVKDQQDVKAFTKAIDEILDRLNLDAFFSCDSVAGTEYRSSW